MKDMNDFKISIALTSTKDINGEPVLILAIAIAMNSRYKVKLRRLSFFLPST